MEYGLIPNIEQYKDNKTTEIQKIQPTKQATSLIEQNKLDEVLKNDLSQIDELSQTQKIKNETITPQFEYTLTNLNFGFNNNSHDFYVKAIRGNIENQYPTEDMMKLKSYLMELAESA